MKNKKIKADIIVSNEINTIREKENNTKTFPSSNDIKLLSVDFISDNERFMEEFIQLKKLAKLEKEKNSLPSITSKIIIEKNSTANDSSKDFDLEKKFQLRGLVHEKEEFLAKSFKQPFNRKIGRNDFVKRNNFNANPEFKLNKRNFNKRNTFNGRIRSRPSRFNNQ